MISLLLGGLWCVGYFWGDIWPTASLLIDPRAALVAGITAVATLPMYLWGKDSKIKWLSLASYTLMTLTTVIVISTTGKEGSPFIVLWMLLTIFAGLFGFLGLGLITLIDGAYATYLLLTSPQELNIPIFILTSAMPLLISLMIWRRQSHDPSSEQYKALARELSQVANKSEIVINSIADGVIAIDHHGTIQLINPAAQTIMGWGKQDAMELDYRSVFKLSDNKDKPLDDANDPIQQVLKTTKPIKRNDLSLSTSTGKKMIISLSVSPVGQEGNGAIIVFRDITGDVAENRQKAEFISTASHEMRTPVASIEGYIGLALNPATATIDEKARNFLVKAHESAQHLGHLFQDLLDVSKAEDGRLSNNPVTIDVISFVRDIVNGLLATAF
ncbi:MAG: histidine kinase dimerization/phospho-acceptor domain-containing protein, partial [Candidatus Saccharimonadales bacterium]